MAHVYCMNVFTIFSNVIHMLIAFAFVGFGAVIHLKVLNYDKLLPQGPGVNANLVVILLCATGCLLFILSGLCIGVALSASRRSLFVLTIFELIWIISQITVPILICSSNIEVIYRRKDIISPQYTSLHSRDADITHQFLLKIVNITTVVVSSKFVILQILNFVCALYIVDVRDLQRKNRNMQHF